MSAGVAKPPLPLVMTLYSQTDIILKVLVVVKESIGERRRINPLVLHDCSILYIQKIASLIYVHIPSLLCK